MHFIAIVALLAVVSVAGAGDNGRAAVALQRGLARELAPRMRDMSHASASREEQFVVQFGRPITVPMRALLEDAIKPGRIAEYVGDNAYVVLAKREHVLSLRAEEFGAQWIGELPARANIHPTLDRRVEVHLRTEGGSVGVTTLYVTLVPDAERTTDGVSKMASRWRSALPTNTIHVASHRRLVVSTPVGQLANTLDFLSEQNEISWVETKPQFSVQNKYTVPLSQGGVIPNATLNGTRPLQALGLDGSGQVVGVGDTGLDVEHCMFFDPNHATPFDTTSTAHRKVVRYDDYVDRYDSDAEIGGGHGTHVAGTIAGNSNVANGHISLDDGVAPGAKLAMFDLSPSTGNVGSIETPADLTVDFFPLAYAANARIHSNSWGSSPVDSNDELMPTSYSSTAQDFDRYMYDHSDFLAVVAAGNDGDYGLGTINTPGTAKNVLTVGASFTPYEGWQSRCCLSGAPCLLRPGYVCTSTFLDALEANVSVLNEKSMATFSSEGPLADNRMKPDVVAPGEVIVSARSNGPNTTSQCDADLSALIEMRGTSMATPHVAGLVAILRQYFTEGWYPSGTKTTSDALAPSGSLMKAMIINGAVPVPGRLIDSNALEAPTLALPTTAPNPYSGFGRANLETLYVAGANKPSRALVFLTAAKYDFTLTTGGSYNFCVVATAVNGVVAPMKWTLVWTDPPASLIATVSLVNDLDLQIWSPNNSLRLYPNGGSRDNRNVVEQVTVPAPVAGLTYCAYISGYNIPMPAQKFSLVASGPMPTQWSYTYVEGAAPPPPPATSTSTTGDPAAAVSNTNGDVTTDRLIPLSDRDLLIAGGVIIFVLLVFILICITRRRKKVGANQQPHPGAVEAHHHK